MSTDSTDEQERIRALALSLDCIAEPDLCLLADITPTTAESWRKRGKGPAYALIGNRYLYPRSAVADYLRGLIKERSSAPCKGAL
ncbi:MAG: helix-turn-helix domain-containing protein [Rhizobacter sp.]|nr:helix-turn-helix domain-containing protein [Rhizobacter sp.]